MIRFLTAMAGTGPDTEGGPGSPYSYSFGERVAKADLRANGIDPDALLATGQAEIAKAEAAATTGARERATRPAAGKREAR